MIKRTYVIVFIAAAMLTGARGGSAQPFAPAAPYGVPAAPASAAAASATSTDLANVQQQIAERTTTVEGERVRRQRIDAELASLEAAEVEQQRGLVQRARALYRIRRAGLLPVAGGFDAMLSHLSRVQRLERIVQRDIRNIQRSRERRVALRRDAARLERATADVERELAELRLRQQQLEEQQRLAMMYEQAFMMPTLPVAPMPGAAAASGMPMHAYGPTFASMRGRLGIPTSGSYRTRDVQRDDGPAVQFTTEPSAPARAVADGQVAFAQRYADYGLMVIVDHGQSFFTVYAGLGGTSVRVGDSVRMGQRVGSASASTNPQILFQVRRGTRALDPRSWLGI